MTENQEEILKRKFYAVVSVMLLKVVLDITYACCIHPVWRGIGFAWESDWFRCFLSNVYCFVLAILLPENENKLSALAAHIFLVISVVPFMIFYWTNSKSNLSAFMTFFMAAIFFAIIRFNGKEIALTFNTGARMWERILFVVFIVYIIGALWVFISGGGIDLRAFSFEDVYQIREEGSGLSTIESYIMNWVTRAFTPFFIGYFLYKKKYVFVSICVVLQICMYLTFGHKSFFLSLLWFCIIFLICRLFEHKALIFNIVFSIMGMVAIFFGIIKKGILLKLVSWQGIMRLLFEPAKIKFQYFEFFAENDKLFFSEGVIGKIFHLQYPYDMPIGYVIAEHLYGFPAVNNNCGVVGDMYSQMGYGGMILGGILLGIFWKITNQVSTRIPMSIKLSIVGYVLVSLNDNALQTVLLTGGWGILIVLLLIFNSELCAKSESPEEKAISKDIWVKCKAIMGKIIEKSNHNLRCN